MPGGKTTVVHDLPDLESYLARKRYPLSKWMQSHNLTSPEAFKSFISASEWFVSPTLQQTIAELLKPVSVAATALPLPSPEQAEEVVVEQSIESIVVQPVFVVEELVAEEPVLEVPVSSSHSFKDRKKSR